METTNREGEGRAPGALPPEVEAELRQRAERALAGTPAARVPPAAGEAPAAAIQTQLPPAPRPPGWQERLKSLGPIGIFLAYLLGKLKFLVIALKSLPFLTTGGSMLLSMAVYALGFGWWFACGFVLCIFVHEMGHVYVAWRMGVPVTAPIFIPGFGALILQKRAAKSAWDEALIGIGGPLGGTLAALFCLWLYHSTRNPLMLALANTGFFLNLFNMAPIFPLDGGWITGAVSPRLWLLGIVGLVALFVTGTLRNPLILVLVLLSLPRLLHGLRTGDVTPPGGVPTTPQQRILMGAAYIGLCAFLFWMMTSTHALIAHLMQPI